MVVFTVVFLKFEKNEVKIPIQEKMPEREH